jgi:hypothetical protein
MLLGCPASAAVVRFPDAIGHQITRIHTLTVGKRCAIGFADMSLPRPVYPGTTSMVTRRCTQRQYLLRPDRETNNAVIYCLAVAAQRCNIDVILFTQMSNHIHHALYDRLGNAPAFYEHFHKLLAKCMNALRGRWENFFASEQVCVVRMDTREELIRRLV